MAPIAVGDAPPGRRDGLVRRERPVTEDPRTLSRRRRLHTHLKINFSHSFSLVNPPKSMPLVPFASLFLPQEYCFPAFWIAYFWVLIENTKFFQVFSNLAIRSVTNIVNAAFGSHFFFSFIRAPFSLYQAILVFYLNSPVFYFVLFSNLLVIISFTDKERRKDPLRLITLLCIVLLFFLFYANIELLLVFLNLVVRSLKVVSANQVLMVGLPLWYQPIK